MYEVFEKSTFFFLKLLKLESLTLELVK